MPPWLETAQVIVGTGFVLGTIARGTATWVLNHTIKRDITRINERIDELKTRMDNSGSSEMWDDVQKKVGSIEIDQRLLSQRVGFVSEQLSALTGIVTALSNNMNAMRENRRSDNYRKNS